MADGVEYGQPIEALERSARVPPEQWVAEEDVSPPRTYVDPEDLDRMRLLGPTGAGSLDPRR